MLKILTILFWTLSVVLNAQERDALFKKMGIVPVDGKPAPVFELPDLEGNRVSLENFKGKIVFVNFWATWCPACKYEMPSMEKLWQNFKNEDFIILAVDLGESEGVVRKFVEEKKLSFPILLDKGRSTQMDYSITAIPTTYIIDREGKIIGKAVGAREWDNENSIKLFHLLTKKDTTTTSK